MERLAPQGTTGEALMERARGRPARLENLLVSPTDLPKSDLCSVCGSTGWKGVGVDGVRRVTTCACALERARRRKLEKVPPRYRWARLKTLNPHPDLERWGAVPELQARVIGLLNQSPDDSYAFFGPTGVGKTTYLYAIYQHAVQVQLRACWCVQMPRLVSDLRALEFGTEKEPCLCRRMIQDAQEENLRPRIFVDEFDKVNVTDFALNSVGELVDTIYNFSGQDGKGVQFVMATNLNRQEFVSVWGNHILRRIEEMARVVDFFEAIAKLGSLEGNQLVATR